MIGGVHHVAANQKGTGEMLHHDGSLCKIIRDKEEPLVLGLLLRF